MKTTGFRIGTRGSQLALWQANSVARLLDAAGIRSELVIIKTTGDRHQDAPLSDAGGKRLFVKEIEDALLRNEIDLAVHSAKDMPAVLPEGLTLAATLPRDDPRDVLVLAQHFAANDFPAVRARLGDTPTFATGSARRAGQLAVMFPGATFAPIRGNVDTRLRKLDAGGYDALVLAAAGLRRLGLGSRITAEISIDDCVPAPGQAIIAIETRCGDESTRAVQFLNDKTAEISLTAERSLVRALGGGCQLPLGGFAQPQDGKLDMRAVVASADGRRVIKARFQGNLAESVALGERLADELGRKGAFEILEGNAE
jgi:hydroxymethylbilane synthase